MIRNLRSGGGGGGGGIGYETFMGCKLREMVTPNPAVIAPHHSIVLCLLNGNCHITMKTRKQLSHFGYKWYKISDFIVFINETSGC